MEVTESNMMLTLEQLKEQVFFNELGRIERGIQDSLCCGIERKRLTEYNHFIHDDELRQRVINVLLSSGYELLKSESNTICIKL